MRISTIGCSRIFSASRRGIERKDRPAGFDDHSGRCLPCLMDPVDQLMLGVGLAEEDLQAQLVGDGAALLLDLDQRLCGRTGAARACRAC